MQRRSAGLRKLIQGRKSWTTPDVRAESGSLEGRLKRVAKEAAIADKATTDKPPSRLKRSSAPDMQAADYSWRSEFRSLRDRRYPERGRKLSMKHWL